MSEVSMVVGRPEAGAHYAGLYNEAQHELAALREELAMWKTKACEADERETDGLQRLADVERRNAELVELLTEVSKQAGDHHMSHQTWNLKTQLANIHQKLEAALTKPEEAKS